MLKGKRRIVLLLSVQPLSVQLSSLYKRAEVQNLLVARAVCAKAFAKLFVRYLLSLPSMRQDAVRRYVLLEELLQLQV